MYLLPQNSNARHAHRLLAPPDVRGGAQFAEYEANGVEKVVFGHENYGSVFGRRQAEAEAITVEQISDFKADLKAFHEKSTKERPGIVDTGLDIVFFSSPWVLIDRLMFWCAFACIALYCRFGGSLIFRG